MAPTDQVISVAGVDVATIRGGSGKPLLMLHDELGFPGWTNWLQELETERDIIAPHQPAYGRTEKIDWIRSYRDLGGFYSRMIREMGLAPIDVIGFSAGGYIAAEMAAADPNIFSKMILVAPMGLKPDDGEIMDFLAMTMRTHLRATVADITSEEFGGIYGGEMTPEQFERFEEARAETARLGWEPFMFNPSLDHLLGAVSTPTQLIWGTSDLVVPYGCIEKYLKAVPHAELTEMAGIGHRPEIEDSEAFLNVVRSFLA